VSNDAAVDRRGRIVLVGTPIGNLGDLAPRAIDALTTADVVACEDTRRTGRLYQLMGITPPRFVRLDDHTEATEAPKLVDRAAAGEVVALVSDAGLPGLSDPGGRTVALAAERGVLVEVVPGPFAGAVAVVASGLLDGAGRFCFEGFLPRKGLERSARLSEIAKERRPVVIYEAPHRVVATINDLIGVVRADRRIALCRELTKMHEEIWRGSLGDAAQRVAEIAPRGEYVLVLDGAEPPAPATDSELSDALAQAIAAGMSRRDAAAAVARDQSESPNRLKRLVAELDRSD